MTIIPAGFCQCGCGGRTRIPTVNNRSKGHRAGIPVRFIKGHHMTPQRPGPNPSGFCLCGCGKRTPLAKKTDARRIKGQPLSYLFHHKSKARTEVLFHEEDRGYKTPCWIFELFKNPAGYGRLTRGSKTYQAHRVIYEQRHGPIAAGLELDHLCFVTSCVNPDHLEPVTPQENCRRRRIHKKKKEAA